MGALPRILYVEDHARVRESFCQDFASVPAVVEGVGDLPSARKCIREGPFDLIILDLHFRDTDETGFDLLQEVRKDRPGLPVVLLSAYDDPALVELGRACGARGFCSKFSSTVPLVVVIRKILAGESWFEQFEPLTGRPRLTPRQLEAAQLAIAGLTEGDIAIRMRISVNMVELHIRMAKRSLGAESLAELGAQMVARGFHLLPSARERVGAS